MVLLASGRERAQLNPEIPFYAYYTRTLRRPLLAAQRAAGPAGALAPGLRGVEPRGATIVAECVVVGAARRLAGVVLVDARGADDGEPPQHVARGGAERPSRGGAWRRPSRDIF